MAKLFCSNLREILKKNMSRMIIEFNFIEM